MTLTPERIAEIERSLLQASGEVVPKEYYNWSHAVFFSERELAELCRLARLGLRVESAPLVQIGGADGLSAFLINHGKKSLPSMQGKRVALVVQEYSE